MLMRMRMRIYSFSLAEPRLLTGREGLVRTTQYCSLCSIECNPIRLQKTRDVTSYAYAIAIVHHNNYVVLCIKYTYIHKLIYASAPYTVKTGGRQYPFKKEQEKAILAFTQGRDVSVALPKLWQESASTGTLQGSLFS